MDNHEGERGGGPAHEAVTRLYELAREGDTDSSEYMRLDSLVHDRLLRAYGVQPKVAPDPAARST